MNQSPIVFFDGVCNLCNSSVQFIIKHDPEAIFKFSTLQGDFAKEALKDHPIDTHVLDSTILLENGKIYTRSSAALQIAKQLNGGWPLLFGFYIVPKFIRDFFYNIVAKNRYKIWGKQESCWIPTPELKSRFIN
ncbi:MAG: thiol-disulfide oxidoreductase DCC family protein [Pedobacter sp.]|nr:MAG: thiol-disulfide oxidoreductase DCC family protein [Pedobacter sp.]